MKRVVQDPKDPAFVQNPYPFYAAQPPLFFWEDYGMVCARSYAAVNQLLRDRRLGRTGPAAEVPPEEAPFWEIEAHSMLELEPPRHTRLRGLVLRAFTSRRIAALGPEIEALAHRLIDALPEGPFDLITGFAQPLPVIVIARLLGVPEARAPDLLRWSNTMVRMYMAGRSAADGRAAAEAAQAFSDFLRAHIAARRADPQDDLISHLIAAEEAGDRLSTEEMLSTCILLLNAGHEATVHTLGNGVKALLEADHREIDESTIEEVLRYDPPLHLFTRWVYEPVDVMGTVLEPGTQVGLLLAAANRDEGRWEAAARFNPRRPVQTQAGFGAGTHFCIGAPLARLELLIALNALFARMPEMRIAAPPVYGDIYHFHGLERLMLTRGPRASGERGM